MKLCNLLVNERNWENIYGRNSGSENEHGLQTANMAWLRERFYYKSEGEKSPEHRQTIAD